METMAVTKALNWLKTTDFVRACILSDSMNMLRKIQAGSIRQQWLKSLQEGQIRHLTFIFVPGHAGVKGNERADQLAGSANIDEGHALDRADIINAIREAGRKVDCPDICESASLSRMKELGVKRGIAKYERLAGDNRRMINQHRTGVVS